MIPHRFAPLVSLALVAGAVRARRGRGPERLARPGASSPVPGASAVPGVPALPGGDATFGTYTLVPLPHGCAALPGPGDTPFPDRRVGPVRRQGAAQGPRRTEGAAPPGVRHRALRHAPVQRGIRHPDVLRHAGVHDHGRRLRRVAPGVRQGAPQRGDQRCSCRASTELVTGMLANARSQATRAPTGTPLADPADRVVTLLQLAGRELGLEVGALSDIGASRARAHQRARRAGRALRCWAPTSTTPCTPLAATTRAPRP